MIFKFVGYIYAEGGFLPKRLPECPPILLAFKGRIHQELLATWRSSLFYPILCPSTYGKLDGSLRGLAQNSLRPRNYARFQRLELWIDISSQQVSEGDWNQLTLHLENRGISLTGLYLRLYLYAWDLFRVYRGNAGHDKEKCLDRTLSAILQHFYKLRGLEEAHDALSIGPGQDPQLIRNLNTVSEWYFDQLKTQITGDGPSASVMTPCNAWFLSQSSGETSSTNASTNA